MKFSFACLYVTRFAESLVSWKFSYLPLSISKSCYDVLNREIAYMYLHLFSIDIFKYFSSEKVCLNKKVIYI